MAKKLRGMGTGSSDVTVTPTGSGLHIFYDAGDAIEVYKPQGVEGADTIYTLARREPKARGATYSAIVHGSGA
jgi:hypothetical protein